MCLCGEPMCPRCGYSVVHPDGMTEEQALEKVDEEGKELEEFLAMKFKG